MSKRNKPLCDNYPHNDVVDYLYDIHADYVNNKKYLQTLYYNYKPNTSADSCYGMTFDRVDIDKTRSHERIAEPFITTDNTLGFIAVIIVGGLFLKYY